MSLGDQVERSDVDSLGSLSGKWAASGVARAAPISSTCQPMFNAAVSLEELVLRHFATQLWSGVWRSSYGFKPSVAVSCLCHVQLWSGFIKQIFPVMVDILRFFSRHAVCSHGVVGAFGIRLPSICSYASK